MKKKPTQRVGHRAVSFAIGRFSMSMFVRFIERRTDRLLLAAFVVSAVVSVWPGCRGAAAEKPRRPEGSFLVKHISDAAFAGATLIVLESANGKDLFVLSYETIDGQLSPHDLLDTIKIDHEYALSLRKLDSLPTIHVRNTRLDEYWVDSRVVWKDGKLCLDTVYVCDQLVGKFLVRPSQ